MSEQWPGQEVAGDQAWPGEEILSRWAAPAGGEFGDLSAQSWAQGGPAPVEGPGTRIIGAVGEGLAKGGVQGASGETTEGLRRIGVLPPSGQAGTWVQQGNESVWAPLAAGGDLLLRGGNALIGGFQRGAEQTGIETGQPQLGRAVAALPEAFPTGEWGGTIGVHPPVTPPNKLAAGLDAGADRPYLTPDAQAQIGQSQPNMLMAQPHESSPTGVPRFVPGDDIPTMRVTPTQSLPEAPPTVPIQVGDKVVEIPAKQADVAQPTDAAGAQVSTTAQAKITPAEAAAYRATAEGSKLLEAQRRNERDETPYVQGVQPNTAEVEQTVHAARDLKQLNQKHPEVAQDAVQIADDNSEARLAHFDEASGSPTDLKLEKDKRGAQAEADLKATWANKTSADASAIETLANNIKESPDGRRPLVRRNIDSVMDEMRDKDGNLLTDPEQLYGVRKHIDDLLDENDAAGKKKNERAKAALMKIKDELDRTIEAAAPGFGKYLKNFADASKRVDEMGVLQEHRAGLFDTNNRMQYSRVQRMMKNLVDARMIDGIRAEKSITPETMAKLFALRDDLRRSASAQDLARAAGSDTAQNLWHKLQGAAIEHGPSAVGAAVGGAIGGPVGVGAGAAVGGGLSSALTRRATRAEIARGKAMLRPTMPPRNSLGP